MSASRQGWSESVCWRCGGEAESRCALTLALYADRKRAPDAMGFLVKKRSGGLRVRVEVPRCRNCRAESRGSAIAFALGLVLGGAAFAGGYRYLWQVGRLPAAFPTGDDEFTLWVLGFVGAFAGALFCFAVLFRAQSREREASGLKLRSYDDFPPIAALLSRGWTWPSSD